MVCMLVTIEQDRGFGPLCLVVMHCLRIEESASSSVKWLFGPLCLVVLLFQYLVAWFVKFFVLFLKIEEEVNQSVS